MASVPGKGIESVFWCSPRTLCIFGTLCLRVDTLQIEKVLKRVDEEPSRLRLFSVEKIWLKGYERILQNPMCGGGEKNLEIRCLVCSSAKSTDTK